MTHELVRTGNNNFGALLSFLRVLAVAEASALLPLWIGVQSYPTLGAMGLAAIPALLLTIINYLRPGEVRFGVQTPNTVRAGTADAQGPGTDDGYQPRHGRLDAGTADTRCLAVAALVVAVVVLPVVLL